MLLESLPRKLQRKLLSCFDAKGNLDADRFCDILVGNGADIADGAVARSLDVLIVEAFAAHRGQTRVTVEG